MTIGHRRSDSGAASNSREPRAANSTTSMSLGLASTGAGTHWSGWHDAVVTTHENELSDEVDLCTPAVDEASLDAELAAATGT